VAQKYQLSTIIRFVIVILKINYSRHFLYEMQNCSLMSRSYKAFHGFGQVEFAYDGSILGSSQLSILFQPPLKTTLNLKVVKIGTK